MTRISKLQTAHSWLKEQDARTLLVYQYHHLTTFHSLPHSQLQEKMDEAVEELSFLRYAALKDRLALVKEFICET